MAAIVAKIQLAMVDRRVRLQVMSFVNKVQAKQQELVERIQAKKRRVVGRMKARYHALSSTWRRNQHFTFCFIPADGQNIAKTHVKKTHLKYAMTAVASFLVFVSCTIGVLAHFAVQNEQQKQELAAYKQNKSEQEQTIRQLRLMAETNQKKLAALSKLEDQVRSQMEKSGAQLPPKSNASDYAGQGGPVLGSANPANIVLEQEKNIGLEADAKKVDLENLLSAIEAENYRREVTPSQPVAVIFHLLSAVALIPLAVMAVTGILVLILPLIMASRFMPVQQAMYSRQAGMAVMEFMHV